jgi:hypothetical protein
MNIKDLKEAVGEIMSEYAGERDVTQQALDDLDRENAMGEMFASISSQANPAERKILKQLAKNVYTGKVGKLPFEDALQSTAAEVGLTADDLTLGHEGVVSYICGVVTTGSDGYFIQLGEGNPDACPLHWGAKPYTPTSKSGDGGAGAVDNTVAREWVKRMPAEAKAVWAAVRDIYDEAHARGRSIDFNSALSQAARKIGGSSLGVSYFKRDMAKAAAIAKQQFLAENKKKGFGEGVPPKEEIYKKREVVQEIEAETPDVAKKLGDASKAQGETTKGVADAHTRGAEAAETRQKASKAWKDAKVTQIKAIDAAEKHAAEETKAADVQQKAIDAAQKAATAVQAAQAQKEKMIDIAMQANEQEKDAASAAEEAAKVEGEAEKELADTNTAAAKAGIERSELETDFGDAVSSDEEARGEEDEAESEEEEELKADEEEADKNEKEAEMEAADEKAERDAEAADKEKEAEDEEEPAEDDTATAAAPMTEVLKTMVREVLSERKWGDGETSEASTEQKLKAVGITADELKGMVLNTMMAGEEDRDLEMIKILKDMLVSMQSIEYHTTPVKGASSKHAQTAAAAWVNEGNNKYVLAKVPGLINEFRAKGMHIIAEDQESFFKWALGSPDLTMQEIKNEADAQIADLRKMLRKMTDYATGKEDSLEKQKFRGEVPGHH